MATDYKRKHRTITAGDVRLTVVSNASIEVAVYDGTAWTAEVAPVAALAEALRMSQQLRK